MAASSMARHEGKGWSLRLQPRFDPTANENAGRSALPALTGTC